MNWLGQTISDQRLLALIGSYLYAGMLVGEHMGRSEIGISQGDPRSPLLANILLDPFDKELERRGHRFARYADDRIIPVKSQRAGERVMPNLTLKAPGLAGGIVTLGDHYIALSCESFSGSKQVCKARCVNRKRPSHTKPNSAQLTAEFSKHTARSRSISWFFGNSARIDPS